MRVGVRARLPERRIVANRGHVEITPAINRHHHVAPAGAHPQAELKQLPPQPRPEQDHGVGVKMIVALRLHGASIGRGAKGADTFSRRSPFSLGRRAGDEGSRGRVWGPCLVL